MNVIILIYTNVVYLLRKLDVTNKAKKKTATMNMTAKWFENEK